MIMRDGGLALQAQLAAASSLAWCFLTGIVSVPEEVLRQVAPVLLVRLLHHLNSDTATTGTTTPAAGSVSQPLPQVTLVSDCCNHGCNDCCITCSLQHVKFCTFACTMRNYQWSLHSTLSEGNNVDLQPQSIRVHVLQAV